MKRIIISFLIGALLVLAGLLVPTSLYVSFLSEGALTSAGLSDRVVTLKAILVGLGLYALFTVVIPVGRSNYLEPTLAPPVSSPYVTLVMALLLLATGLRLYALDVGIWYDEMLTHANYMPLSIGQIVSTFTDANNHILYSVAARATIDGLGDSVWSLRLPAAIFGVASIWALYFFARRVASPLVALFSVALITVSYHHIWFSQNARGYTMLLFFALLSSAFLFKALDRNRPWLWVLFAITGALGALTHLSMGLLMAAQFLVYLGREWRESSEIRRRWWVGFFFGFIPLGLLTLLVHGLVLRDIFEGNLIGGGLQDARLDWLNPFWAAQEILSGLQVGLSGGQGTLGLAAVGAAGFVFLVGVIHFLRTYPAVLVLFFVPVILGFTVMTTIGYTLFPRFFFFTMGFAVVILVAGAAQIGSWFSRLFRMRGAWGAVIPSILCLAIVGASVASLRWVYAPKQSFEAAIAHIEANRAPEDTVVAVGIADFPLNTYFAKGWEHVETAEELTALRETASRTWVVYTMPVHAKTVYGDVIEMLDADYLPAEEFFGTLSGGTVVVHLERDGETG
jgi:uncharacterized membrane protein